MDWSDLALGRCKRQTLVNETSSSQLQELGVEEISR